LQIALALPLYCGHPRAILLHRYRLHDDPALTVAGRGFY
jgi:hypothetical protein